jgi:leucyl/phenylalanyl-tRNA--protein transferase
MKNSLYTITFDEAFDQVIESCASVRTTKGEETWITEEMKEAYITLHRLGYAHSVECRHNGTLVGGLYGVALDRVFFGESMFTKLSNASKIALASLTIYLKKHHFKLIDCQMTTEHLLQYGACEIPGREFRKHLKDFIVKTHPDGKWKYDTTN